MRGTKFLFIRVIVAILTSFLFFFAPTANSAENYKVFEVIPPDLIMLRLPKGHSGPVAYLKQDDRVKVYQTLVNQEETWSMVCFKNICGWVPSRMIIEVSEADDSVSGSDRNNIRIQIGPPKLGANDDNTVRKYAGLGEIFVYVPNSYNKRGCANSAQFILELIPGGRVKGVLTTKMYRNLLTCVAQPTLKRLRLFGSFSGGPSGKISIGTDDGSGRVRPDWMRGNYNRLVINLKGKLVENEIGIEGYTTARVKLRRR